VRAQAKPAAAFFSFPSWSFSSRSQVALGNAFTRQAQLGLSLATIFVPKYNLGTRGTDSNSKYFIKLESTLTCIVTGLIYRHVREFVIKDGKDVLFVFLANLVTQIY
jgi:hypothetical protein